jgi:DNA processing protein
VLSHEYIRENGIGALRDIPIAEITQQLRLSEELLDRIYDNQSRGRELHETLEDLEIQILVQGDDRYPWPLGELLGEKCPPVLFAHGNLSVLDRPGVGVCGSRHASDRALAFARDCGAELVRHGCNVIAGYAQGVDLAAHQAALDAGGTTTLVLAEGILKFQLKGPLREIVSTENTLVVSEFVPTVPWATWNAMQRNHTICGLSRAMVLVESSEKGGTFEAGKVALDSGCPLFVATYAEPAPAAAGNSYFLGRGAAPLTRTMSGEPDIGALLEAVAERRRPLAQSSGPQNDLFAGDQ